MRIGCDHLEGLRGPSLEPLLAEALLALGVLAFSMVVYAIVIQPWLALIEVLH